MSLRPPRLPRPSPRLAPLWAALAALAGALAVLDRVFRPRLALASPDSAVYLIPFWKERILVELFGEHCEVPTYDTLLALLLPPAAYSDLSYVAAAAATAAAAALYLRRRRCSAFGAVFGGLAIAFGGYHFSLFSAGHRGYAVMMPHALLLLAAVDGMVAEARWPWAVVGAVASVCALRSQPDVFVLWCGVVAAYALVRAVRRWRAAPGGGRAPLARRWGGVAAVFLATVALFGGRALRYTATSVVAGREAQIASAGGAAAQPSANGAAPSTAEAAQAAERRWDFATSWSLPPHDLPELACANLRGYDSGNPRGPYWGALGRSVHFDENGGQGFVNFRQHTLYLGALPLALALFALTAARRPREPLFWGVVAGVALLLAMGRHTPLYRLFYALPGMSGIRGPVKFLHLAEIAVAMLAGFGTTRLEELLRAPVPARRVRRAALATAAVSGASALALLAATLVDPAGIDPVLAALGAGPREASVLRALLLGIRAKTLLVTAAAYAAAGAALLFAGIGGQRARARAAAVLPAVLCALLLLDMGRASAPYVNPVDIGHLSRPNVIAEGLRSAGQLDGSAWAGAVAGVTDDQRFRNSFDRQGLGRADPAPGDGPDSPAVLAATHFRSEPTPFRRWQLLGARLAFVAADDYAALPPSTLEFAKLGLFAYDNAHGAIVKAGAGAAGIPFGVLSLRRWTPGAAVYPVWEFAPDETAAWARLEDPGFDFSRSIVIEDGPACTADPGADNASVPAAGTVDSHAGHGHRMVFETAEDSPAGMLLVRRPFPFAAYSDLGARVDGRPAPAYVANRFSRAVPVPAGHHRVELFLPVSAGAVCAVAASLALLALAVASLLRHPGPDTP